MHRSLLPAFLLFLASTTLTIAQDSTATTFAQADTVIVKKVTGVNAFTTSTGDRITIIGIAMPKSKAIDADDAKQHLAGLVEGQTVVLVRDTATGPDKKGSKLRYVYVGGRLINKEMIDDGFAVATGKHSMAKEFVSAENESRKFHKAAWGTERLYSIQCQGTTRKGTQCSRMTTSLSGRCWQHE